ncbi:hypothetical protein P153DRAFT_386801 [Dothidotthia symphoricarpi CBS 119687]|uniref:Uncharacterized protein n=1 Tax=Dothidotthia symphoricarpi CBS 119687 TaxID=1392245 RepID=A0A6A6AAT8_9PLEO|nr:uncharacterized protein P153DRAFT_386801 [Dothidotthia symphoricarpi CBS 119687]KAF2128686.1 hypothetical protein P153DRAFT_386801 [Dothidotthia symphoricarpi CBS 119687]
MVPQGQKLTSSKEVSAEPRLGITTMVKMLRQEMGDNGLPDIKIYGLDNNATSRAHYTPDALFAKGDLRKEFVPVTRNKKDFAPFVKCCFILKGAEIPTEATITENFIKGLKRACRKYPGANEDTQSSEAADETGVSSIESPQAATTTGVGKDTPAKPNHRIRKSEQKGSFGQRFSLQASINPSPSSDEQVRAGSVPVTPTATGMSIRDVFRASSAASARRKGEPENHHAREDMSAVKLQKRNYETFFSEPMLLINTTNVVHESVELSGPDYEFTNQESANPQSTTPIATSTLGPKERNSEQEECKQEDSQVKGCKREGSKLQTNLPESASTGTVDVTSLLDIVPEHTNKASHGRVRATSSATSSTPASRHQISATTSSPALNPNFDKYLDLKSEHDSVASGIEAITEAMTKIDLEYRPRRKAMAHHIDEELPRQFKEKLRKDIQRFAEEQKAKSRAELDNAVSMSKEKYHDLKKEHEGKLQVLNDEKKEKEQEMFALKQSIERKKKDFTADQVWDLVDYAGENARKRQKIEHMEVDSEMGE